MKVSIPKEFSRVWSNLLNSGQGRKKWGDTDVF